MERSRNLPERRSAQNETRRLGPVCHAKVSGGGWGGKGGEVGQHIYAQIVS